MLTGDLIHQAATYLLTGRGHRLKPSQVDQWQLREGIKIEYEHTRFKWIAQIIAMDHLEEFPDYYTRLLLLEKEAGEYKRLGKRLPNRRP